MGRPVRYGSALLLALLLVGCGAADEEGVDAPDLDAAAVCPGGTVRDAVVLCTELQPEGEPLALPEDDGSARYGALTRGGDRFLTRSGALELSPTVRGDLLEQLETDRESAFDADSGAAEDGDVAGRTGPYASTVYVAKVDGGTVVALRPAVRVDETALMTRVFGGAVLEGTIAPFVDQEEGYDLDPTLPVRIELAASAQDAVVSGHVVNASRAVRLSTGGCAPALTGAGAHDPLQEPFTEAVTVQRYPSMHTPFDDELLLKWSPDVSSMGSALFPSAATLLGLDPLGPTWDAALHGNPLSGPLMTLALVEGGGGTC